MIRWVRSWFAWRMVREQGVWAYLENDITGRRAARRLIANCYSPLDFDWLDGGIGHPEVDGRPAWRSAQGQRRTAYFL